MRLHLVARRAVALAALLALTALTLVFLPPPRALASPGLGVEVWTDRGDGAVYRPGESLDISARVSDGAYLLVYEIDAEGAIHVLYPYAPHEHGSAYLEGGSVLRLPGPESDFQLVVQGPVGEGYIVAIASREPFERLPWFLRSYDARAEELGYQQTDDGEEDTEGVTAEGRIVGDPFVAMERIRRRVLAYPSDRESFATDYASYYVHHAVRYPRYLCSDCHRPGHWAWWDGFDPYYASCSAMDFRVNASWWWGPSYWFGHVPYYVFVFRPDCPPHYRPPSRHHGWASSWDGWKHWTTLWSGPLRRFKSAPPPGYIPPSKFDQAMRTKGAGRTSPPGFLASSHGTVTPRRELGLLPGGRQRAADGPAAGRGADGVTRLGRSRSGGIGVVPRDRTPMGWRDVERPLGRYGRTSEGGFGRRPVEGSGDRGRAIEMPRSVERGRSIESPRPVERGREAPMAPRQQVVPRRDPEPRSAPPPARSQEQPREVRDGGRTPSPPARDAARPSPATPAPRGNEGGSRGERRRGG